jgi:endo-1,4-beta-xylanase
MILMALILSVLLTANPGLAQDEDVPAQLSVTVPATNFVSRPAGAAGNGGWTLNENGTILSALDFPKAGTYTFILVAGGRAAQGVWPEARVLFDSRTVLKTAVSSTNWGTYTFSQSVTTGRHAVSIGFLNDFYEPPEDRNLTLLSLTVVSPPDVAAAAVVTADEYASFESERRTRWPAEADARIAEVRQGKLTVWVADANGQPATNTTVTVRQTRQDFLFGTALCTSMFEESATNDDARAYREWARKYFNHAVTENALKWPNYEPTPNSTNSAALDRMVDWCSSNNIPLRGHCLFWGCEVPDWVRALTGDALPVAILQRARGVPARYAGRIAEYDLVNEPLHCRWLEEQLGPSIVGRLFSAVHMADPGAVLYANEFGIVEGADLDSYVQFLRGLKDAAVDLGGIGVQAHFREDADPLAITAALDALSVFNLPIKITEFDCASTNEEVQARCLETVLRAAFAHPAVTGFLLWGFWENCHWRPEGALLRSDFSRKPSAETYERLVLSNWWTRAEGRTDAVGRYECSAFFGDLAIEARTDDGRAANATLTLVRNGEQNLVTLHMPAPPTNPPPEKVTASEPAPVPEPPADTPDTNSVSAEPEPTSDDAVNW